MARKKHVLARRPAMSFLIGSLVLVAIWSIAVQNHSVHTNSVSVKQDDQGWSITCDTINPHVYPVVVELEASLTFRGSKYHPPREIAKATKEYPIPESSTQQCDIRLPSGGGMGALAHVRVVSVTRGN